MLDACAGNSNLLSDRNQYPSIPSYFAVFMMLIEFLCDVYFRCELLENVIGSALND